MPVEDAVAPAAPAADAPAPVAVPPLPPAPLTYPPAPVVPRAAGGEESALPQPGAATGESAAIPEPVASTRPRRSKGAIVAIWLLAIGLVLAVAAGAWLVVQFLEAQEQISDQKDRISEQEDEIERQKELIDRKDTFGAAMNGLLDTAAVFQGVPTTSIVPWDEYQALVNRAWGHRWDAAKLTTDTEQVVAAAEELGAVWAAAQQEVSSNATGTAYESVIDRLGAGLVRSLLDRDSCGDEENILGCVWSDEPYLVHFDAAADVEPFMTDELRTGIAYHEFAHVLQFTNQEALDAVLPAFSGDHEVMADCFALTFLPGWKLDHRIWVSSYEYWDVSIGYGQVCSDAQKQAVRDWYAGLPVTSRQLQAENAS